MNPDNDSLQRENAELRRVLRRIADSLAGDWLEDSEIKTLTSHELEIQIIPVEEGGDQ